MGRKSKLLLGVWLAVTVGALAAWVLTRSNGPAVSRFRHPRPAMRRSNLVDQKPLETARALAALAWTREEHPPARRALSVADDSVDLAFAIALRDAAAHPPPPTEETRKITARLKEAETSVAADQDTIAALQGSKSKDVPEVQQLIALAQAQLTLDQEEAADARQDLLRAGGDLRGRLKKLLDEHVATHNTAFTPPNAAPAQESWPLASHLRYWKLLHDKQLQLTAASQEATAAAAALSKAHDELESRINRQKSGKSTGLSEAVTAVRGLGEDLKSLADYDKRVQNEQDLAEIYRDWAGVVAVQQRASVHGMIQDVLWILLIVLGAFLVTAGLGRLSASLTPDRKRLLSLQFVVRFAVQAVALLLIVLVVVGAPGQMTTIIGLAGAGLTVALKDFIVAFFGWFALMGKNGIRVGDWVEINGIGGEVVEIGLLRTVLLETGQWSDAGHPTGRKVAFVNSFAIEGHYFNFSTAGQWSWDDIEVLVPSGDDPYRVLQSVQDLVVAETQANVRQAEQEWLRAAPSHALQAFSAAPAINVKPTNMGVNIMVRYITRAHERYEMRARLYRAIVELLHRRNPNPEAPASEPR
jgi:small-conductance mechanosensitive channel